VARLDIPVGLKARRTQVKSGSIPGAERYHYQDEIYQIDLIDQSFGLNKKIIMLLDDRGSDLAQSSVVWRRTEFLQPMPDRVVLGPRAVRVFLLCPDEEIELTKVRSTPTGVKAVITSPREVTIRLSEGAPRILDDVVEVETTAEGRPPLRIPVVRYSPSSQSEARTPSPSASGG
jgi:hypothetical protein